jgi:ATP/ADP translocase
MNSNAVEVLAGKYPHLQWFIRIAGQWSYALMYIFAELWSSVVINLMFWQFVNHISDAQNSKRFYPLYGVIGNFGIIAAGQGLILFQNIVDKISSHDSDLSIQMAILSVAFVGLALIFTMMYITKTQYYKIHEVLEENIPDTDLEKKPNLSLMDSIRLIIQSKNIAYMTLMIMCYSLAINILEGPWKHKVSMMYHTQQEYMSFMGHFNTWLGISCVLFMVVGSSVVRICSWLFAAMVTPVMIGLSGLAFFTFVVFSDMFESALDMVSFNPLVAAVIAGATQNILRHVSILYLILQKKWLIYRLG